MKTNELIIVKQLPVIEEHLKVLAAQVKKEVKEAKNLVCTADTIKSVKSTRSGLNKKFKELETMRKEVKNQVMNPYADFEKIYKECVTEQFKEADVTLKTKIAEVEDEVKQKKENDVKLFFDECITAAEIDFVKYEQAGINVTLSASTKSLKASAKEFVDKISDDLKLINVQEEEQQAEILVEYKKSLNCSLAITMVAERHKKIAAEKERKAEAERIRAEKAARAAEVRKVAEQQAPVQKPVQAPTAAPTVEKPEVKGMPKEITVAFKVTGTIEQLKAVKKFLVDGGYKYE